jgi:hypothetical protein
VVRFLLDKLSGVKHCLKTARKIVSSAFIERFVVISKSSSLKARASRTVPITGSCIRDGNLCLKIGTRDRIPDFHHHRSRIC